MLCVLWKDEVGWGGVVSGILDCMLGRSLLKFKQSRCREHPDESYSLVCLEAECPQRGVICA